MILKQDLKKISDWLWEIPRKFRAEMLVPARVYASEKMLAEILEDRSLEQLVNVATLPGIQKYALAMPDIHEGYGFPIGGVAAFAESDGIISPGGIGYDINCGVRLLRSDISAEEIDGRTGELASAIFRAVPSGAGRHGVLKLDDNYLDGVFLGGASALVKMGYGEQEELKNLESNGCISDADPAQVSAAARNRGRDQLGTMGAGNHFVEVDRVEEIFDETAAKQLGLFKDQVVVLIHTGSRGLGHQVATDHIRVMQRAMPKYGIKIPDRELACTPFRSEEGQNYFRAMAAAANFAFANRQMITHSVRRIWNEVFDGAGGKLVTVYDVAHNIAKLEDGFIVHRKGATRAFPNQPVLIPGSMGTASYVLLGEQKAAAESFSSSCHGAGRRMSRHAAKRMVEGTELKAELEARGIAVAAGSFSGLAEEAPAAYKDVDEVVEVVVSAGIARKVVKLKPLAVIKG